MTTATTNPSPTEFSPKRILVVGSSVLDNVVRVDEFPKPGESVVARSKETFLGGKGCNQAVAAARLGAEVTFAGAVGNDASGHEFIQRVRAEGINANRLLPLDEQPTGSAFIMLNHSGQNTIAVLLGANMAYDPEDGIRATHESPHEVLLLQGEIPIETNRTCAEISQGQVIFNPAPALHIPPSMYPNIDYLTPNEHEAATLIGEEFFNIQRIFEATSSLLDRGCRNVIITLGSQGAAYANAETRGMVYAPKVKVVDTVGAGDCFNGALAFAIAHNADLESATRFAVECASLSVQQLGAQSGLPYWYELEKTTQAILQNQQSA